MSRVAHLISAIARECDEIHGPSAFEARVFRAALVPALIICASCALVLFSGD